MMPTLKKEFIGFCIFYLNFTRFLKQIPGIKRSGTEIFDKNMKPPKSTGKIKADFPPIFRYLRGY